ncbi:succinate dehydrogenase, hydrophobic membrane anchor protein [Roseospirillum parvum]|uniref:Succinate dehydrogenase hydrophobic membrane anchor subunit n=1 Tax=Roseospirillum parvum TaxID=83401 RepID=A0A1G7WPV3_9PROT|nr:succinate dehydrogenase, hydrophobic membrane anchor protein [Roseospirillum parvum]SDG74015.1 succinate dehydrogenase / fumarate reductase membrane anchor subunit [Roseospirillum parvum]
MALKMQSPLGRARGRGAAKSGIAHHWFMERLTAVALVPLMLWFVAAVIANFGASHAEISAFFGQPWNAALMIMTILFGLYHGISGLMIVLGDYIHGPAKHLTLALAVPALAVLAGIYLIVCVLILALGG